MTQDVQKKKRRPWWLRLILYLSPLWIILAIVLVVEISGRRAYKRAMQEARAIGGPVTFEELEAARKAWPDDRNGALILSSLAVRPYLPVGSPGYELLPVLGGADLPPLGEKWSDQTDKVVRGHLAQFSVELGEINRLARYQGGRFLLSVSPNIWDTPLTSFSNEWPALCLKSLNMIHEAMHGNAGSLATDMGILLTHGRTLADEPFLGSARMRVSSDSLAIDTLEEVLAQTPVVAEQLRQLETLIEAMEEEDRLLWGLRGQRAVTIGGVLWMIASGSRDLCGTRSLPLPANTLGMKGWLLKDLAFVVSWENKLVQAKTAEERMRVADQIDSAVRAAPRHRVLLGGLVPPFKEVCDADLRLTALARAARVAMAVERYRLDKGQFPADLAELVPACLDAVPTDPFDDRPLRYRLEPDAVIIYSIAEDRTDDGGRVRGRLPPKTLPPDVGFVLLKPEFRGRPASTTAPASQDVEIAEPPGIPASQPVPAPGFRLPEGNRR